MFWEIRRPFLPDLKRRTIVWWDLYLDPPFHGKYHLPQKDVDAHISPLEETLGFVHVSSGEGGIQGGFRV